MKKNFLKTLFVLPFIIMMLAGGAACSSNEDYVTEQEMRAIIREELRSYLTQDQIQQLINNSIPASVSEDRVKQIIAEELKGALTQDQINQIIAAVGPALTEAQIREIIKQEVDKMATGWQIINIAVKKEDWAWNTDTEQYEVIFDVPELTEFIYEEGAVLGYVFFGQQGVDEVQMPLPYVFTYKEKDDNGNTFTYTETISFDYQLGTGGKKSSVAFYIQASDRFRVDDNLTNYNYRIVLIW